LGSISRVLVITVFHPASEGIYYCAKNFIINGKGTNAFSPKGNAARQEAAIVLKRAYDMLTMSITPFSH